MAQVTRDIIQLKKSKTGDVFYPETHMQAVIGLNGNKDANTVLAGPTSGSAGPASFRPLYPTDIIPLFTKEYTYKCTANNTNNGNIYFMNVTPTSNDWATPWSVHYTLQVDCLTSEDANSKYCHGFYDIYVGSAGSNYYYHVFNTFYSSSYYPVYYHKLLYHNTEAKYTNYHITNPVKLGARIQSAWGANTRTRIYNIKVYDYKNCTISFPENIEIYGDVYRDTYYNTIDWNATSTGLQETSDQNDTTTMNLYYTRLQAGTNGIKQYSLVMQDKNGKWQSFTKGAGGTATTKEKNDAEFRLGSRIYRMERSSDLGADGYLSNGQVQAYCGLIDLRYSLNIVSNNSATGGSVGLTQYKPVYIVGTINSNGYFVLDDIWWTQDEPITEDGKIYIRVVDSVYLDNTNNPDGQYRGDLISDGYAYYYKNGSFQRYVIADSANTVPWSGVTGRPSFYDLVIKASDATTLLTYKPTTSGTYQLTLNKSNIGLGNVENTALSTWTGTNKITTVGTITSGTWNGSTIAIGKGGTGLTTYTKGDMLYASANNTLAKLGANTGTKKFLSMASSVPSWEAIATSDLPAMYIGKTAVKFENTTEQALTGISTGAFSSSITVGNGSTPASNEQASTTQKRRIYFGSSNYYIEVDKNGYLHTNVGFYSDSFVSAGGLSNAGGSSGIDSDALWELLAAGTSEQINSSHLPKGSAADLNSGTSTTGVTWGAKTIADYVTSQINTTVSSALYFRGQSSTAITNGGTETATINGHALVAQTGDLVLYDGKEFAWDGTHWIQFGDESSWASKNITISTSGYLTGGGDLTTSRTISINTNKISDSSAASSLSSTSTNLVTERDIYYGLPTINNSHAYTSGTTIYAPTSAGTANQVLLSGGANTAPTWGNASGLSVGTASKLGSSTVGSTTKPIYLSSGTATECNTYAGGTAVTLNGTSKTASTASFYAPTGAGTNGYILKSNGSGEPSWVAQSTLSVGTASKLGSDTVGSSKRPIYLNAGTATQVSTINASLLSGYIAGSVSNLSFLVSHPEYESGGVIIPYIYNDLAFLTAQGGSAKVYSTTSQDLTAAELTVKTLWSKNPSSLFDSSPSYWSGGNDHATEMNEDGLIIDIVCNKTYSYATRLYIDFGSGSWGFDNVDVLLMNSNYDTTYTYKITGAITNGKAQYFSSISYYTVNNQGAQVAGFNRMRIHLSGRTATYGVRIAQVGLIQYNSIGQRYTTMSRGYDDYVWRSISPAANTYNLGDNATARRWGTVYGVNANFSGTGTISGNTTVGGTLGVTGNTTLSGTLIVGTSSANKTTTLNGALTVAYGGATIKGTGNAVTNINGASATVDYAHIFVNGGNNNTRPLVLQNGYGNVGIGVTQPSYKLAVGGTFNVTGASTLSSTLAVTGLATLSGGISLGTQYTPSGSSTAVDSKLVWDSTNKAWHLIGNFYADGFISAGGLSNSSGGGGVDIDAVWASLTNSVTDEYASTRIAQSHLPAISSSGSGVVSAIAYSGSGNNLVLSVTKTAVVTSLGTKTGVITLSGGLSIDSNNVLSSTDTKNTAGADNTTSKIFLVGPTAQTSSNGNARTYSNVNCYASGGKLYSNAVEVVNLSNTQALTNKTYNGYTLAAACAKAVDTSISAASTSANLPTSAAVASFVEGKGYITSYTDTWRGVYTGGTSRVGTGTGTKAINFVAGSNVTVSYEAAGTGSGQSGNANYFNVKIAATDTTYTNGTGISLSGTTFSLNVAGAKTALGLGSLAYKSSLVAGDIPDISATYVTVATAQTISAKHTFSSGILLNTASSWTNSDRAIAFSADGEDANIRYYYTDSNKGLTFNPNTGELKAAKFTRRGGTSSQFLKADGSVDSSTYLTGNQTITLSGDVSGSGTTSISVSIGSGKVTNAMLAGSIAWSKLSVSASNITSTLGTTAVSRATADADGNTISSTYVKKAGDTMTGDLIIEKTGGGLTIRGERLNSNANGGYIYLAGRYYDNDRNGVKIAAEYPGSVGYDIQDLVIYTSYNCSDNASPVWQEAMRIAAQGQTFINGQYTYSLYIDNVASGATSAGIRFRTEGTTVGGIFVNSSNDLYFAAGTSSSGSKILTASNYDGYALPLAGGTMTGSIKLTNGTYINAESGYAMCGVGSGGETFYCGPGAEITSAFYIRSGNINLTHVKAGTNYTIWDASNSNLSTVDWAVNNLTAAGIGTFDRVVLSNSGAVSHIEFTRAGWNYISVPTDGVIAFNTGGSGSANTSMAVTPDGIRAGTKGVHSCGLPTAYWGSIYGKDLYIGGDAYNTAAGSIIFSEKLEDLRNGFKIAPVHAASANRVNLVFYRSNNGNSPYAASWTTFMTLSYDGKVTIAGSLTTSGDQVISSDATLKTNWRELNYTVKDIANVKIGIFDWKNGHGTSAGSIAQDWKKLIPELVHGEEGNMTLAYSQVALLNTVLLARHEDEQDKEIKELKERIKELEDKVKQLTTN